MGADNGIDTHLNRALDNAENEDARYWIRAALQHRLVEIDDESRP